MDGAVVITILAIMSLTATVTLAVWRTLTKPIGGDRFEDAINKLTGKDSKEIDTTLASSTKRARSSWNKFWYGEVIKTGRIVNDEGAPGRLMAGLAVLALFFGLVVFPGGPLGAVAPVVVLVIAWAWFGYEQTKRRRTMERQLPLLLSTLRSQMTAGMTVQAALLASADSLPSPLGDEIRQVKADVSVAIPLEDALNTLAERLESRIMFFLVSSIGIALRSGSDLIPQLVTIEEIVRQRARIEGRIRSALAMAKPTSYLAIGVPVVLAGYLFLTDPKFGGYFFGDGILVFLVAMVMFIAGIVIIRTMIKNVEKI